MGVVEWPQRDLSSNYPWLDPGKRKLFLVKNEENSNRAKEEMARSACIKITFSAFLI